MHATGHYGAGLLLYAPVGFALLLSASPTLAFAGGAVVLFLSTLPDWDLRLPLVSHRGITHTLLFLAVVAAGFGAAGWQLGSRTGLIAAPELAAYGVVIAVIGVGSHLVADMLTPAGVPLLWPLSGKTYSVAVARASNPIANWALLALGVFATASALVVAGRVNL